MRHSLWVGSALMQRGGRGQRVEGRGLRPSMTSRLGLTLYVGVVVVVPCTDCESHCSPFLPSPASATLYTLLAYLAQDFMLYNSCVTTAQYEVYIARACWWRLH